jgi:hypothetical protein
MSNFFNKPEATALQAMMQPGKPPKLQPAFQSNRA